jgi:hypothetical protein
VKEKFSVLLNAFLLYGPIIISIIALYYARKKDKLLYATRFFPQLVSLKITQMDINLENLGPGMASDIRVSAYFLNFRKWRRTLHKEEVYTLEYLEAKEKCSFSVDGKSFVKRKFSELFKEAIQLEWRSFDNKKYSVLFVIDHKKRRFVTAHFSQRILFIWEHFVYASLNNFY